MENTRLVNNEILGSSYKNAWAENLIESILSMKEEKWNHFAKDYKSSIIPFNAKSGTGYKGLNKLKLMFRNLEEGYTSPYYITRETALKLKANFKGEKLTKILRYIEIYKHKETGKDKTIEAYKKLSDDEKKNYKKSTSTKRYFVLNLDQISNLEEINKEELILNAPEFIQDFGISEEIENLFSNLENEKELKLNRKRTKKAFYRPSNDSVTIPIIGIFKNFSSYYSVTFHELIHWTGHESRLNRFDKSFINSQDKTENYAFEELIAEIGALLLCNHFNIDETFYNSCIYLKGWLNATNEEDQEGTLRMAVNEALKAKNYILNK